MSKARTFVGDNLAGTILLPDLEPPQEVEEGEAFGVSFLTRRMNRTDTYAQLASGRLAAGNFLFVGQLGGGKTTAMKDFVASLGGYQAITPDGATEDMRIFIDNRKSKDPMPNQDLAGEWANVVNSFGCKVINVETMSLEIFDPHMREEDRFILAILVCKMVKKEELSTVEKKALRIALHKIERSLSTRYFSTPILEQALRRMNIHDIEAFNERLDKSTEERFANDMAVTEVYSDLQRFMQEEYTDDSALVLSAAKDCARYFQLILEGEFGKTFAGDKTLADYCRQRASMFHLGDMSDEQVAFFESIRFHTLVANLKQGDLSVIPHLMVREEIQEAAKHVSLLESWAYWSATSRARHTITLSSTQYLANLFSGQPGSDVRRFSEQIYNGLQCLVLFQQPNDETTVDLLRRQGLNFDEIALTSTLPVGCALIKYANRPAFTNQFILTPVLEQLTRSREATARMVNGRRPVEEDPRIKRIYGG